MVRFLKRVSSFVLIIILLNYVFVWLYEKPIRQAVQNKTHKKYVKWNDIQNSNYDAIFLGSSRSYCAYNPLILDSILKTNSYNMSTGSQNIIESYYILKDILKNQKPNMIIYELSLQSFSENTDYYHVLSNGSFMSIDNKFDMIINGFGKEGLVNYLLPILKHKPYISRDLFSLFSTKSTDTSQIEETWVKGYFFDDKIIDIESVKEFQNLPSFENTILSEKKIEYFNKLVDLCKQNKIKLIGVRAPFPPSRLKISPPDSASIYFNNICQEFGISFYDFNYMTNTSYSDFDFSDSRHMNKFGAQKVSTKLAELLNKGGMSTNATTKK